MKKVKTVRSGFRPDQPRNYQGRWVAGASPVVTELTRNGKVKTKRNRKFVTVRKEKPANHTGAMVALIPSIADLNRLDKHSDEPTNELHCTLYFIGEIQDFDYAEALKLQDWLEEFAKVVPPMECRVAGIAEFNPTGEKPAHVLILNNSQIAAIKRRVNLFVESSFSDELVTQHEPFIPHITLAYGPDALTVPADIFDNPLTLDTIRLAWGDQVIDFPLAGTVVENQEED